MYRDDVCAVCGESLPPDHFYCRRHGAEVDARLHAIADHLPTVQRSAADAARLLRGVAEETWDYVAESQDDDADWPPRATVTWTVDTEAVEVDVDEEPGMVRVQIAVDLPELLETVAGALAEAQRRGFVAACADVEGADATH